MPGPVSDSYEGPGDWSPYVPAYCYENGPKMCSCGHHEGYHNDAGACLFTCSHCHFSDSVPEDKDPNK